MRRKQLASRISAVPSLPHVHTDLEAHATDPEAAADLLLRALADGDIKTEHYLDLGCGTGRLSAGLAFLGVRSVVGIDVEPDFLRINA